MEQGKIRELYERYAFVIYGRCLNILGGREEAEDAMHEVFVKFMDHFDALQEGSRVAWLFRTAQNHCFNLLRYRRKFADPSVMDLLSSSQNLEQTLQNRQLIQFVLGGVPDKVAAAVTCTYLEELNQEEIGSVTGQSPATIRRNLEKFREHVAKLKKRIVL